MHRMSRYECISEGDDSCFASRLITIPISETSPPHDVPCTAYTTNAHVQAPLQRFSSTTLPSASTWWRPWPHHHVVPVCRVHSTHAGRAHGSARVWQGMVRTSLRLLRRGRGDVGGRFAGGRDRSGSRVGCGRCGHGGSCQTLKRRKSTSTPVTLATRATSTDDDAAYSSTAGQWPVAA